MAEFIHNQTIEPTSSDAQSLITLAQSINETESGLTAPFNQTATSQTITFDAAVDAQSLFTISKTIDKTDTSLTAAFNTEFVSQIVFDILLTPDLSKTIGSFDEGGIPIIFYERSGTPEPIIFYSRVSPEPIIFYARGETQRHIDQGTTGKFTAPFNFTFEQAIPTVESADAESLITMDKTHDQTDTSLAASFSTAVV
jgi:hypothetical protein